MNCLDITTKDWNPEILKYAENFAPNLAEKLDSPAPSADLTGYLSWYWVDRFGMSKECRIINATGDNPSSLAGLRLDVGDLALSLGTSDTLMMAMKKANPQIQGHVFVNPIDCESYMGLLCYKNGSLTRQEIRDKHGLSWDQFSEILRNTEPKNSIFIHYPLPEITPFATGSWKFSAENEKISEISEMSKNEEIRCLIEGQIMAKKNHVTKFGFEATGRLIVTGGASKNEEIVQIIADVFDMEVYNQPSTEHSAAMGAAYRALAGAEKSEKSFHEITKNSADLVKIASPNKTRTAHYKRQLSLYEAAEKRILSESQ